MMRKREAKEKMKRRIEDGGEELSNSSSSLQLKRRRFSSDLENFHDHASCCLSNVSTGTSKQKLATIDLKEVGNGGVEMETTATFNVEQTERNQTSSFSDLQEEETKVEPAVEPPSTTEAKMPSDAELQEFFSTAEKHLQNQFSKKYNFDIVREEALEGRYEWDRVTR